jgi:hypothetical protein
MIRVWNFVTELAIANKGYLEIKETMETVCGDKALKKTAIYAIIKKGKTEKRLMTSAISMEKKHADPSSHHRCHYSCR